MERSCKSLAKMCMTPEHRVQESYGHGKPGKVKIVIFRPGKFLENNLNPQHLGEVLEISSIHIFIYVVCLKE